MPPVKFTEQWLATVQPGEKPATYWDATVTGFCVLVGVAGTKTFYVMTRVDGRKTRVKIGRAGARAPGGQTLTVSLARRKAQEILGRAASGELATATPKRSSGPTLRAAALGSPSRLSAPVEWFCEDCPDTAACEFTCKRQGEPSENPG